MITHTTSHSTTMADLN